MSNAVAMKDERQPVQVMDLIEAALTRPEVTPEKLLGLLEVQRQVRRDEAERAFNEAMNLAQAEMEPVRKDASNPQTHSKYASYAALDAAIRPIYTKHGFSVSFDTADSPLEGHVRVVAKVARGAHAEYPHIDIPADGKGAKGGDVMTKTHATMSAVSYGKRGLQGMIWNIATTDRDDDGNGAGGRGRGNGNAVTEEQAETIRLKIVEAGADLPKFLEHFGIARVEELPARRYDEAYRLLNMKKARSS